MFHTHSARRAVKRVIVVGMLPPIWLLPRLSTCSDVTFPMLCGSVPTKASPCSCLRSGATASEPCYEARGRGAAATRMDVSAPESSHGPPNPIDAPASLEELEETP